MSFKGEKVNKILVLNANIISPNESQEFVYEYKNTSEVHIIKNFNKRLPVDARAVTRITSANMTG